MNFTDPGAGAWMVASNQRIESIEPIKQRILAEWAVKGTPTEQARRRSEQARIEAMLDEQRRRHERQASSAGSSSTTSPSSSSALSASASHSHLRSTLSSNRPPSPPPAYDGGVPDYGTTTTCSAGPVGRSASSNSLWSGIRGAAGRQRTASVSTRDATSVHDAASTHTAPPQDVRLPPAGVDELPAYESIIDSVNAHQLSKRNWKKRVSDRIKYGF